VIVGAFAKAVMAVFAILVWRVYRNQLVTMENALAETRESNILAGSAIEMGRRSWLVPALDFKSLIEAGAERRVEIYISNTGGMPGVIKHAEAEVTVGGFKRTISGFEGMIVTPRLSHESSLLIEIDSSVTDQEIKAPDTPVSVSCEIKYVDVLGMEWETKIGWCRYKAERWDMSRGSTLQ
jgi:hypothetical protein